MFKRKWDDDFDLEREIDRLTRDYEDDCERCVDDMKDLTKWEIDD